MNKLKINTSLIFLLVFVVFLASSCADDFEEINVNPAAPIEVEPSLLLRQVIWSSVEEMSYEGYVAGNLLGQYFTAIDFNLFDRHSLTEPQFGGNPWPVLYSNLRDNQLILDQAASDPNYAVYEGPARILKAYLAAQLTDIYGDVPYSEALNGKAGIIYPVYDAQEQIYLGENGILDHLRKAIISIDNYEGVRSLEGDILYNGDLMAWKRLANSLLIKYLVRISDREDVGEELQAIYEEGFFIVEAFQNAAFDFSASQPNNFRMANLRTGDFNLFIMSETAEEIFLEKDDPRVAVFYREAESVAVNYSGLLNGPDASQLSISVSDYSLGGRIFREETDRLDGAIASSWETSFFIAEAAERGLINANAIEWYENGIHASFDYWGVEMPVDYLSRSSVVLEDDALEKIATQKWMSNCINGYESWIEYRRTGFPKLKTIAASLNGDLIPVRMPYPTDEAALNAEAYNVAAESTGGNSINHPVWWDVN